MPITGHGQRRDVNPEWIFILVRLMQIVFILAVALVSLLLPVLPLVRILCFVLITTGCVAAIHSFAHVAADESGLFIRRYVETHFVRWGDVSSVECSFAQGGIKIVFRTPGERETSVITNFPNMSVTAAAKGLARQEELEIVTWMRDRIRTAKGETGSTSVLGLG